MRIAGVTINAEVTAMKVTFTAAERAILAEMQAEIRQAMDRARRRLEELDEAGRGRDGRQ